MLSRCRERIESVRGITSRVEEFVPRTGDQYVGRGGGRPILTVAGVRVGSVMRGRHDRRFHVVGKVGDRTGFGLPFGISGEHRREVLILNHQNEALRVPAAAGVHGEDERGGIAA